MGKAIERRRRGADLETGRAENARFDVMIIARSSRSLMTS